MFAKTTYQASSVFHSSLGCRCMFHWHKFLGSNNADRTFGSSIGVLSILRRKHILHSHNVHCDHTLNHIVLNMFRYLDKQSYKYSSTTTAYHEHNLALSSHLRRHICSIDDQKRRGNCIAADIVQHRQH